MGESGPFDYNPRMTILRTNTLPVCLLAGLLALTIGCASDEPAPETASGGGEAMSESVTELVMTDANEGTGAEATAGRTVVVHYTGWLYDSTQPEGKGAKFDSSRDRNEPFSFGLGGGQVIRGWDEGVAGMKTGGNRTLIIPPNMGYGSQGAGGAIPPNTTLIFDVELLEVQ